MPESADLVVTTILATSVFWGVVALVVAVIRTVVKAAEEAVNELDERLGKLEHTVRGK